MLVEVQALVSSSSLPQPRRSAQGLDAGRLALLVAVLARHAGVRLHDQEVYVSAVGGVRINEPAADLAIALALASALRNRPVAPDVVACGEIGLGGEVRQVHQTARRLAEAARLGFRRAIVPVSAPDGPPGMVLQRASTVAEAVAVALADAPAESVPLTLIRG